MNRHRITPKDELTPDYARYTGGDVIGPSPVIGAPVSLTQGLQGANPTEIGVALSPEICVL
jgi:hypothetical protein